MGAQVLLFTGLLGGFTDLSLALTSVCFRQGTTYQKREYNMKTMRKITINFHTVANVNKGNAFP